MYFMILIYLFPVNCDSIWKVDLNSFYIRLIGIYHDDHMVLIFVPLIE